MFHNDLTNSGAGNLFLFSIKDFSLYGIHHLFNLIYGYWSFIAGSQNSRLNFTAIILFSVLIFFDHSKRNTFHLFICGKSPSAGITQTTATDRIGIFYRSGINYSRIILITKWTLHTTSPFNSYYCFLLMYYILDSVKRLQIRYCSLHSQ